MRRLLPAVLAVGFGLGLATTAEAKIYKYTKADGTVIYTDKLSDLPNARRAYYNKQEQEAAERQKARENQFGKEELKRRAAEAERAKLMKAQMEEQERSRRLAALDETLKSIERSKAKRGANKAAWQKRIKDARARLQENLQSFRKTQDAYNALAMKAGFTLFPGQAEEKERLRKQVTELEAKVDASIHEVYVTIPEEARKAGALPGWIR